MLLQEFIKKLDKEGELIHIKAKVNPELEITEIVDRISKSKTQNKALLFENNGSAFPLLINMFGSESRIAMALGYKSLYEIEHRIESTFSLFKSTNTKLKFFDKLKMLFSLKEIASYLPKETNNPKPRCQQNIMTYPDLSIFPILKLWPNDGGKFITLPAVHTKDPITGNRNVGMYRLQVFDKNTTGMHWHMHKGGAEHYRKYKEAGIKKMPVAVTLGGDPVYTYVATAPLPDDIDEYVLAGFLRQKPVKLVKCLTQDIYVPEDVDIVIEGYVDTEENLTLEGPFGDHTGFYSLEDYYPKFHITAITYANNAIYPATIVGIPPQEDKYIAEATSKIFLPMFRNAMMPELKNWHMPDFGVAHNLVIASVKTSYPHHSNKIAHIFWGAGQMSFNKVLILISDNIKPDNYELIYSILLNTDIQKNIYLNEGILDILDHTPDEKAYGGKMLIDLTSTTPTNQPQQPEIIYNLSEFKTNSPVLIWITKDNNAREFLKKSLLDKSENVKFAFLVDVDFFGKDWKLFLWFVLANCEISRDVEKYRNSIIIDGRMHAKTNFMNKWPNPAISDKETIQFVTKRWEEYGFMKEEASLSAKLNTFFDTSKAYFEIDKTE
jgi:4-hydroxy-3-polyprenylbenzoate decarboxylase